MARESHVHPADLYGWSRLAVDGTGALADLVEAMHGNIVRLSSFGVLHNEGSMRGITGFVYRTLRGVTDLVGTGLDVALAPLAGMFDAPPSSPQREAALAVLNGVLGDHLAATGNPLAITMRVRSNAQPVELDRAGLAAAFPQAGAKVLLMVHGSCRNDLQWTRKGHEHGAALARDLGYTPLYLHYNSGLHVSANGRSFAALLESLVDNWPAELGELSILAHSMGGLVSRSACHYGSIAGHRWPSLLRSMVFLGTPHHGSPLERGGHMFHSLIGAIPHTAPLGALGRIRSAGVTDLRHGNVLDEDWQDHDRFERAHDCRRSVPLPQGVACCAIAATLDGSEDGIQAKFLGDGLVPVPSALGRHRDAARTLQFEPSRQWIACGMGHFDLLSRAEVYDKIRDWLAA